MLVIGSHPHSGFSMLNFSSDAQLALTNISDSTSMLFKAPKSITFRFLRVRVLQKYSTYVDKFLFFGPYLTFFKLRSGIDLIHILDHSDAPYRFYLGKKRPVLITVHDLFATNAARGEISNVSIGIFGKIYQRAIESGLRGSNLALPISESTRKSVLKQFPKLKTRVVHNFVFTPRETANYLSVDSINLSSKYFLILMNSHWRKDRFSSIQVWKEIISDSRLSSYGLVIVGSPLTSFENELIGDNERMVDVKQNLSHEEIAKLYSGCAAVINISKYEGFGMPIIEANINKKICVFGGSEAFREIASPENIEYIEHYPINTSELLLKMDSQNVERAYEFTIDKYSEKNFINQMTQIYRDYLK